MPISPHASTGFRCSESKRRHGRHRDAHRPPVKGPRVELVERKTRGGEVIPSENNSDKPPCECLLCAGNPPTEAPFGMFETLTPRVEHELKKWQPISVFDFVHLVVWGQWKPYHVAAVLERMLEAHQIEALPGGKVRLREGQGGRRANASKKAIEGAAFIVSKLPLGDNTNKVVEMTSTVGRLFDIFTKGS